MVSAEQLGSRILAYGKQLAPDRFPSPDGRGPEAARELCKAWGEVLGSVPLPADIWGDAVRYWALHMAGDRMATPRDLRDAAYQVRDVWETHPQLRECLERARRAAREERDRQLAEGTFGQLRGYKSRALGREAPREGDYGREVLRGLLRRVGRPVGESMSPQDRREGP